MNAGAQRQVDGGSSLHGCRQRTVGFGLPWTCRPRHPMVRWAALEELVMDCFSQVFCRAVSWWLFLQAWGTRDSSCAKRDEDQATVVQPRTNREKLGPNPKDVRAIFALRVPAWILRLNFQARRPSAHGSVSDNVYMIPNMGFTYMQWEYLEPSTPFAHLFETVCKQCAQSKDVVASCDTNTSSSSEDADV